MKVLILSMACLFSASNAFASATALSALTKRVVDASAKVRGVKPSDIKLKLNPGISVSALTAETMKSAETIVTRLEAVAEGNEGVIGLSKNETIDLLEMIYVNQVNNNGSNKDLGKLLDVDSQLVRQLLVPVSSPITGELFAKFITFNRLIYNGTNPEDASRQATQGSLSAFADNCAPLIAAQGKKRR